MIGFGTKAMSQSHVLFDIHIGAGTTALRDVEYTHKRIIADLQTSYGLVVPTQQLFPEAYYVGGVVQYAFRNNLRAGINVNYYKASALSRYGDYSGTLDIISRARALFVEAQLSRPIFLHDNVSVSLGGRGGIVLNLVESTQTQLINYKPWNYHRKEEKTLFRNGKPGFSYGYLVDVAYRIAGPISIVSQLSYRHALLSTGKKQDELEQGPSEYDYSGTTVVVGARITL